MTLWEPGRSKWKVENGYNQIIFNFLGVNLLSEIICSLLLHSVYLICIDHYSRPPLLETGGYICSILELAGNKRNAQTPMDLICARGKQKRKDENINSGMGILKN